MFIVKLLNYSILRIWLLSYSALPIVRIISPCPTRSKPRQYVASLVLSVVKGRGIGVYDVGANKSNSLVSLTLQTDSLEISEDDADGDA